MRTNSVVLASSAVLLLGVLPLVAAHGDEHMDMDSHTASTAPAEEAPPSYFRHPGYSVWIYAHIGLMILGWIFCLPAAIMLSIGRSRYHIPAQLFFQIVNGLGMFTGFVYNHSTPDLYVSNSHHPVGWVATSFTVAWTIMALFNAYSAHLAKRAGSSGYSSSMTSEAMAQHDQLPQHQYSDAEQYRWSRDSGHGSSRTSTTLGGLSRSNSDLSVLPKEEREDSPMDGDEDAHYDGEEEVQRRGFLGNNRVDRYLSKRVTRFGSARARKVVRVVYVVLEKFLLLLGFTAMATGFVVYGGIFRERAIFSGLAHFIKGGIFFWYGLLTLGRWMGAFSDFGWAWNVRPRHPLVSRIAAKMPSAEFLESFTIFFYGSSNVFLEHLNAWGKAWSPQDFEHVSITLLFFGGGLLGMLIESQTIRNLMNTTVEVAKSKDNEGRDVHFNPRSAAGEEPAAVWEKPDTYQTPLNPIPALVIMLLGMMMSSHHQSSMVATMIHAEWGMLFVAFAMARGVTYITMYLKPPTSHFPARPPSELIAAFCLVSGGLLFMGSAHDTVSALEENGLNAMLAFTVTMGVTGVILAWELVVFAIKGWAVRKERSL